MMDAIRLCAFRTSRLTTVLATVAVLAACTAAHDSSVSAADRASSATKKAVCARLDLYLRECNIAERPYVQFVNRMVDPPGTITLYQGPINGIISFSVGLALTEWIVAAVDRSRTENDLALLRFALAVAGDSSTKSDTRAINDALLSHPIEALLDEDAFGYYIKHRLDSLLFSGSLAALMLPPHNMTAAEIIRHLLAGTLPPR